jgi:hypothetical protein
VRRAPNRARRGGGKPRPSLLALVSVAVLVIGFLGLLVLAIFSAEENDPTGQRAHVPETARDPQLVAGVETLEPWADHGNVPLDTPVGHQWLLRNTGAIPVSLGVAKIETLEGC